MKVSVVVPAYDAAETIAETLESLLAQSSPAWEAVVVDDGSRDATARIVEGFTRRDARIRLIQRTNGGEAAARNSGIAEARHEWLLFLDADDWIAPSYLEKLTGELAAHSELDAVHCGSARVTPDGTVIVELYQAPVGDMFATWARRSAFPVHACIVRRALVEAVGGFDPSFKKSPDWDLWQRVARTGACFGAVREVLAYYRMRPNAASLDARQMLLDGLRVLKQGHAPDPRVPHPHADHAAGSPPAEIATQEFYLLCWCAGLLLGRGEDARPLLDLLTGERFPELYPDAVAQCVFDAAPLPSCEPPAAWEHLWPSIRPQVEEFLAALEAQSQAPDLARRARNALMRRALQHSPAWHSLLAELERQIEDWEEVGKERDRTIERQQASLADLARSRDAVEAEREEWQRISEEHARTIADQESRLETREVDFARLQQDHAALRDSLRAWQRSSYERGRGLDQLRGAAWVQLGVRLGILTPPAIAEVVGHTPGEIPPDTPWQLRVGEGNRAELVSPPHEPEMTRVAITKAGTRTRWDIQLNLPGLTVVAQQAYVLRFRARADRPRSLAVGVARAHAPWSGLGLYRTIRLTPDWQSFQQEFVATAAEDNARIHFDLGGKRSAVEVASVSLDSSVQVISSPDFFTQAPAPIVAPAAPEPPHEAATTPAGRLKKPLPTRSLVLRVASPAALSGELLARIQAGAFSNDEEGILLGCQMQDALRTALEVHNNRWSAHRYRDLFENFYASLEDPRQTLDGATVVDLGCGSINPFGMLFLFLMLGARRGIAIDLDDVQDLSRAARALADLAGMVLIDPKQILDGVPVTPEELLRNIASFDLAKLQAGDPAGFDAARLSHRRESVYALSLRDGEADLVLSNSFFEHIPRVDEAITELARITRSGGLGVHIIDGSDHRRYENSARHPLDFLTEASEEPLVHGSNRVRPLGFAPLFEGQGFEVISFVPFDALEISAAMRGSFREPFRSMPPEVLRASMGRLVVRRR